MKITILALIAFLGLHNKYAQTHELVKHDGAVQQVNFIKQENNIIYYSNPGSQEQKQISFYAVSSIKNNSTSEYEMISTKINVDSKSDYRNVKVLKNESEATGLKKIETFTGQLNRTKGISTTEQFENTTQRIKHRVAAQGYSFVVINKFQNGTYKAIAYTY